ncbi:MAG: DNA polymerase III subunit gamma/tau [Paramuribaculum sp.]|nr:DNA polymerase III subunit gamma/tau [Paramuribaculum sp.]
MQPYLVSARKYRPATFDTVVGQKALTTTLKNAVASGKLAHSYLFCGSRGVGKTSCARIFAKTINCEHRTPDGEACNECDSCKAFNAGTSLNIIELDAASNNSVDDIRALTEQVQTPPSLGKYRVFIVDEVHMLSSAAFNAFLKTLEEPPSYVVFILATTEKHKIIPTILSRCQIYDFHRITIPDMIAHLSFVAQQEGITVEEEALNVIAQRADGAMRDALSIFDQVAASSAGNITYQSAIDNLNVLDYKYYDRLLEAFLAGDVLSTWVIYKEIRDAGFDSHFFINGLAAYFRDLLAAKDPATLALIDAGDKAREALAKTAAKCTPGFLFRAMNLCNEADLNYRTTSGKQLLIELTLAKICQSLSPSPNSSDGEGRLKPIDAANTKAVPQGELPKAPVAPVTQQAPQKQAPAVSAAPKMPAFASGNNTNSNPQKSTTLKLPNFSMRQGVIKPDSRAQQDAAPATARTNSFTVDEFAVAWNNFADSHRKEHILVNAMRFSLPESTDNINFEAKVTNVMQLEIMTEALPRINKWLRDALRNDSVTVTASVSESENEVIYTLNDRELLAKIVEENPFVAKFIERFKLVLS